jgi:hypothetical protein
LYLSSISGGYVANGPASLFSDRFFGRVEQRQQAAESIAVENDLGLGIVTGDYISHSSERCLDDVQRAVH